MYSFAAGKKCKSSVICNYGVFIFKQQFVGYSCQEAVCRLSTVICWFKRAMVLYTVNACPYDGSKKSLTVLVFRDRKNSNFSTTDCCTVVELAPRTGRLTVSTLAISDTKESYFLQQTHFNVV